MTKKKKMTLAEALTYKKRIADAISSETKDIMEFNSVIVLVESTPEGKVRTIDRQGVDIRAALIKRKDLIEYMDVLNETIWKAGAPIRSKILQLAAMKGEVSFLSSLNTSNGKDKRGYDDEFTERDAFLDRAKVKDLIKSTKIQIDNVQNEISKHNYVTVIEIDDIEI